jgi:hypothetical protein
MGDISKGMANTHWPAKKICKKDSVFRFRIDLALLDPDPDLLLQRTDSRALFTKT